MFARPTALMRPSMPVVWSKWPWLQTTASIEPGSMSSRRMFSTTPSGLAPASNSSRRVLAPRCTSTSRENPCSARSASGARPPVMIALTLVRPGRPLVGHEDVGDVVHQGRDLDRVHRFQNDLRHRPGVMQDGRPAGRRAVIDAHGGSWLGHGLSIFSLLRVLQRASRGVWLAVHPPDGRSRLPKDRQDTP